MFAPTHNILTAQSSAMSTRRMAAIGSVGLLHVLIVVALVTGMAHKFIPAIPPVIQLEPVVETQPKTVPPPPKPTLEQPADHSQVTVVEPDIQVAPDGPPPISAPPSTPNLSPPQPPIAVPDSTAMALAGTHTIPPYPPLENKLGHQGTVTLQLSISSDGSVTSATVTQSSGFAELDQAAIAWVTAHWRYKPAIQGGVAVPSQTTAAVKFDLRQARG
jgi:periplasmic protein TonB